jgi:LPXTG-site transpeptidase (sortase) family protein
MKILGYILIAIGVIILILIFWPVITANFKYEVDKMMGVNYSLEIDNDLIDIKDVKINPVNKTFSLIIPKINVNSAIFAEVDPTNSKEYLPILQKGVAQAKGSGYPDKPGNVFLFAHSTDAFYNVGKYNAVFFLIGKLETDDEIDIFYKNKRYIYKVVEKIVVSPEELSSYVVENTDENSLTLQTCYPPGTSLNRLLVIAEKNLID